MIGIRAGGIVDEVDEMDEVDKTGRPTLEETAAWEWHWGTPITGIRTKGVPLGSSWIAGGNRVPFFWVFAFESG